MFLFYNGSVEKFGLKSTKKLSNNLFDYLNSQRITYLFLHVFNPVEEGGDRHLGEAEITFGKLYLGSE